MELLFLTPQMPYPPRQGAAIRNWHLIAGLAREHAVTLCTFGPAEAVVLRPLATACRRVVVVPAPARTARDRVHTLVATRLPDMARRLWSPAFAAAMRGLVRDQTFDRVQVEGIEMVPYMAALRAAGTAPPWLFDEHNAEYLLQRRAFEADLRRPRAWPAAGYSLVQWRRLRRYERAACRAAGAVVAVSEADRAALAALAPDASITVVPNGVDLAEWSVAAAGKDPAAEALATRGPLVVFDGTMDFRPNVDAVAWFVDAIWPRIRAAAPDAQFAVVGRNPAPRVAALAAVPGVTVTGPVADPRPWVAAAAVYVVPMRMGGGVRLKVLQALALERALVSTPLGCEGVTVQDGRDVVLAAEPGAFAAAVTALLGDPARRAVLGRAARAAVTPYAWEAIVPRLATALAAMPAGGPR